MPEGPYCKVTYKTCRNPKCRRVYLVVAAPGGGCKACRRCRHDGYCSIRCKYNALAASAAKGKMTK